MDMSNSTHIPLKDLLQNLSLLNKEDNIMVYCAGGYRSMIACSLCRLMDLIILLI